MADYSGIARTSWVSAWFVTQYDYIPRADADMSLRKPTAHASHCPYKGDAGYFSISANGRTADNAMWCYEQPFPAMAEIAGYLAFYPNRVDKIEESPA